MAGYTVIADISNKIVNLLRENMTPEPIEKAEKIGIYPPYEKGDFSLGIHLYNIEENGEYRPVNMMNIGTNRQKYPPLSLTLYYMITAYSKAEVQSRALDEQKMIGRVMQVLYDNPIIDLGGTNISPEGTNEPVRISLNPLEYEMKLKTWNAPDKAYHLSAFYRVSPIFIESNRMKTIKRVSDLDIKIRG
ncbi:DUF4255 domain-containing protein [Defluviitalea saccharophila]|uniref:DUF4255 domain-containing protein n=1 Tax=Defluviitalea saccharophila TaxID=879970 RepID=A0ABZ2Y726_9FIRM